MRTIAEIHHPKCRISVFFWNQKYLVKLEQDGLEQTFKLNQFDVISEDKLKEMINEEFIESAVKRFDEMRDDMNRAISSKILE
ncbi:MAG TPA: hypothetical protein PK605_06290 [Ignavibacteria bacterium]|nr:hypothetical protein [Bacteroidota bacterium]HRE10502.1 hypothetical protein [Ignavibacteria bacterium]HRF65164.1 hypothetical protein [Ignavibacteria bacterium]HRJ03994.1 hypothetical protein [Ignavibacteria bacterium]HRJ86918.1 hypothetical protein [Ignavibacteria bacterium]